jgi:putative ABC transport system permease protein
MNPLKITLSTTLMNFHGMWRRRLNALVMIISIASVVAVLSGVLAMNAGLNDAMRYSGRADRAIVLRSGATVEIASAISPEDLKVIQNSADISRGSDGAPLIAGEAVAPITMIEARSGMEVNATIRGVSPGVLAVRPEIKIVSGRMLEPGKYEIVVGQQALKQFKGLELGGELYAYKTNWKIVGVYTAGHSMRESELMTDANILMGVSQRPVFQNVTLVLPSAEAFAKFKHVMANNPGFIADVFTEPEFLQRESSSLNGLLHFIAYVMGGIMALGAVFVAINAMYSSIDDRRREIATLRAIGFPSVAVVVSIVAESAILAIAGGVLGAVVVWSAANGGTVSTAVGGDLRQLVFNIAVTTSVVMQGLGAALAIGVIGGLIPAARSVRSQVVDDLRAI